MTSTGPVDLLEERAANERRSLHTDVKEIRSTLERRLNFKRNVREHLWQAAGISALVSAALGYAVVGIFSRRHN
jgi:hypothetical protein